MKPFSKIQNILMILSLLAASCATPNFLSREDTLLSITQYVNNQLKGSVADPELGVLYPEFKIHDWDREGLKDGIWFFENIDSVTAGFYLSAQLHADGTNPSLLSSGFSPDYLFQKSCDGTINHCIPNSPGKRKPFYSPIQFNALNLQSMIVRDTASAIHLQ